MKPFNQKERAIALLAGNGAVVVQAFLFVEGQFSHFIEGTTPHLGSDAHFGVSLLFFCIGGIGAMGFWGSFQAYSALGLATGAVEKHASPADKRRLAHCERLITESLIAFGGNVGMGLVAIMLSGTLAIISSQQIKPGPPASATPATAGAERSTQ